MKIFNWSNLVLFAFSIMVLMPSLALGQPADNMQILREKLRADKKLVVAQTMQLTQLEAKAFWPIYARYQKGLSKQMTRLKNLLEKYAKNYETMNNKLARELMDEWFSYEAYQLKLQRSYLLEFRGVLPEVKVMRYYQMESKIDTVLRYELSSIIPLAKE